MKWLVLACLLSGCATADVRMQHNARQQPRPMPPEYLWTCAKPARVPHEPPRIRTVEQIGEWASGLWRALVVEENGREDCARKLEMLNEWVRDNP